MPQITIKQIRDGIKQGITLFFVHASWCPYTVQFYPIFDKVMNKKVFKDINVIKLDDVMTRSIRANYGDIYKRLADYDSDIDEYKLYFPTVVMFINGRKHKYEVDVRTVQNFEAFVSSKSSKKQSANKQRETKVQNKRENIITERTKVFNHKATSTRPVKLLTLQEQIDKTFQKLFKS